MPFDIRYKSSTYLSEFHDPGQLLDKLFGHPAICPWCFNARRRLHPDHDAALADHLLGRNESAFEALGHEVDKQAGEIKVERNQSTATRDTIPSNIPPTVIDGERKPGHGKQVCECGVVDYSPDDDRSHGQMFEAVENIADRLDDADVPFDEHAAIQDLKQQYNQQSGELEGDDYRVLRRTIDAGRNATNSTADRVQNLQKTRDSADADRV